MENWLKKGRRKLEVRYGKVRRKRYIFQKAVAGIAILLWLFSIFNLFKENTGFDGYEREKMVSVLSTNVYKQSKSKVTTFGKYADIEISDTAKELILEKLAHKLNLIKYDIYDEDDSITTDQRACSTKVLREESANGNIVCEFITLKNNANNKNISVSQYIYVRLELNKNIADIFKYEEMLKEFFEEMQMEVNSNINICQEFDGKMSEEEVEQYVNDFLESVNGQLVMKKQFDDTVTVYGYSKDIKEYVSIGNDRVNINICVSFDEEENVTEINVATPINNEDY